ncbi:hypothetical protein [Marinobacterium litorale]|uniref:hypothetical protein n=1 Tax=Marinobacterium litorale TaxID=404770 RepID=UPI00040EC903|nr:hypothetical protein [Marinobacterium litorale]
MNSVTQAQPTESELSERAFIVVNNLSMLSAQGEVIADVFAMEDTLAAMSREQLQLAFYDLARKLEQIKNGLDDL